MHARISDDARAGFDALADGHDVKHAAEVLGLHLFAILVEKKARSGPFTSQATVQLREEVTELAKKVKSDRRIAAAQARRKAARRGD